MRRKAAVPRKQVARAAAVLAVFAALSTAAVAQTTVFVNEFHYDNTGGDAGEFVEVAGPAGTDLTGWSIVPYNGSNGGQYSVTSLSGSIPDEGAGYGALSVNIVGLQNGSPDGFALVDSGSNVIQFLSYEGSFAATDGPANGMTSTDVGVSEASSCAIGSSIRLEGTGTTYEDFTWVYVDSPTAATPGTINTNQSFGGVSDDPNIVVAGPVSFGAIKPGDTKTIDLLIENVGASNALQIQNTTTITGPGSADFQILTALPLSIAAAGGTDSLRIRFNPSAVGATTATLRIDSDDPSDPNIEILLAGAGSYLIISEIMYNPDSEEGNAEWEWVEIYNSGPSAVNLAGYVLDDNDNTLSGANIAAGTIESGETGVFYNAGEITEQNFKDAWGENINTIAVSDWPQISNSGDHIGIWESFAIHGGTPQLDLALDLVEYTDDPPWPLETDESSIYLKNLSLDNSVGANWACTTPSAVGSLTPLGVIKQSASVPAAGNYGGDYGSPELLSSDDPNLFVLSSVVIGPVLPGAIEDTEISLFNTGPTQPLDLTNFAIADDNDNVFAIVTPEPTSVPAGGESRNVIVRFAPVNEGTYTAVLEITSNDENDALTTVGLEAYAVGECPLIFTEVFYNPDSDDNDWEFVEVYNAGTEDVDLAGFVFDDEGDSPFTEANIAAGVVPAAGVAYLFNADQITAADFQAAWDDQGINAIPVTNWSALNNGGDRFGLWKSIGLYGTKNFATVWVELEYSDDPPWPADDGASSIYLTDLSADPTDGANWALGDTSGVATPLGTVKQSLNTNGNDGGDFASPAGTDTVRPAGSTVKHWTRY